MDNARVRGYLPRVVGLIVLGVVSGVLAKIADEEAGTRWLSDLGTYPAVWVFALAIIARFAPSPLEGGLRATAFLTATCLGYYGWAAYVYGFAVGPYLYLWLGIAVTIVPLFAASIRWATAHRGVLPGLVMGSAAAATLADGVLRQYWLYHRGFLSADFPLHPVQAVVNVILALVIAGLLPRHLLTRGWAFVLAIPMTWVAQVVVMDIVYARIWP